MAILIKLLEVFKTEEDFKLILKEILKEKALVAFLFDSIDISDLENATIENKDEYFDFELLIIKSMVDC
jgi:predicted transcriptional regulator